MALMNSPAVEQGSTAPAFALPGVDGRHWTLTECMGEKGLVVMFICNHCPYVKAIRERLVADCRAMQALGVNAVAIMSNDPSDYPEDSFAQMQQVARAFDFPFPYLLDAEQTVARAYGAVCTPDFFGLDADGRLRYRGRLDAGGVRSDGSGLRRDLLEAMREVATSGHCSGTQYPSIGCSIKWINA